MGLFDSISTKSKISKLRRYRSDLCDDQYAIDTYNKKINNIISDFQSFVRVGNSAVTELLYDYKEPYQDNDRNLSTARNYIDKEADKLERQLSDD